QRRHDSGEVVRLEVSERHVAARGCHGQQVRTCLDAVGDGPEAHPAQARYCVDGDGAGTSTLNVRAHGVEHVGEVGYLGLEGRVVDDDGARAQYRCEHEVLGTADGRRLEMRCAPEGARLARVELSAVFVYHNADLAQG